MFFTIPVTQIFATAFFVGGATLFVLRHRNDWPPLNALAVNGETGMPGEGYDGAPGCDLLRWPEEVRRCIAFGGYPSSTRI